MSAFSIFANDSDPSEDSIVDPLAPAVLSYQRPSSNEPQSEIAEFVQPLPGSDLEEDTLPEVVLRLPDLTIFQAVAPDRQARLASWMYWVGIALGALFALWLIWTPKPAAPPRDEAPAWTPLPPVENTAPAPDAPSAAGAGFGLPQSPVPGPGSAAGASAEVRTARGGDSRWYGNPVGVKPSEAAPLGISTPEPR
jgi:hypothetical protein